MWLLIVFLLHPEPGQVEAQVLAAKPTKEACESFKQEVLVATIEKYNLKYPLTFRLECKQ